MSHSEPLIGGEKSKHVSLAEDQYSSITPRYGAARPHSSTRDSCRRVRPRETIQRILTLASCVACLNFRDEYNGAYLSFLLLGAGFLFPWNAGASALRQIVRTPLCGARWRRIG